MIATGFTDRKLSPRAGSAVFWRFLDPRGFVGRLKELLPHRLPESNNAIQPIDQGVAFVQRLLCGAEKPTQVAYLRRDPVAPAITGIKRVSSQSTLSRFFAVFDSAGKNQRCFWRLPKWLKVRVVRADSGFCENGWLSLLEGRGLSCIVVARLMSPLRKLIVGGMDREPTGVRGVTVACPYSNCNAVGHAAPPSGI